jgi:hypothetical protein
MLNFHVAVLGDKKSLMPLCVVYIGPPTFTMSSSSSLYTPPCMILDDDELEQAQQIRETFSKGRSYAAVAASSLSPSWRTVVAAAAAAAPAPEFANHSRVFGTSQLSFNRLGGFPNAFHTYGYKASAHTPLKGEGRIASPERERQMSKDPPGTLVHAVRMTFYNSERIGPPAPLAIPPVATTEKEGPLYSPKTPPYCEENEGDVPPAELYGGAAAHTPCAVEPLATE